MAHFFQAMNIQENGLAMGACASTILPYHNTYSKQNLVAAFNTKMDIRITLKGNIHKHQKYLNVGVYQLRCQDCPLVFTGQAVDNSK